MKRSYQAMPSENKWVVRNDHSWGVLHSTQFEAWREAKRLARGSGGIATLLAANGEVQERLSFSKRQERL